MKSKLFFILAFLCASSLILAQFNQYNNVNWFGQTNGFPFQTNAIGIGNFQPAVPQSRLHVNNFLLGNQTGPLNGLMFRTDGSISVDSKWQMFTGTNSSNTTEKGALFTSPNAPTANGNYLIPNNLNLPQNNFSIEAKEGDILFNATGYKTSGLITRPLNERMRITALEVTEPGMLPQFTTRVSISSGVANANGLGTQTEIRSPLSMLHMGDPWRFGGGAHRAWMHYGTTVTRQSDLMYIGVKQNEDPQYNFSFDKTDAVIAWGDNPFITPSTKHNYDNLRIIFNSNYNSGAQPGSSGHMHGIEAMRFTPVAVGSGNATIVYAGIGDFSFNNPFAQFGDAVRTLEILSNKQSANANGEPQVRITHTQQDPANFNTTGKYSEYETTNLGDLIITANDNTQTNNASRFLKQRFVGIQTNLPGNTLEINSQLIASATSNGQTQAAGFAGPTGWAGLRFTDLKSTSIPQANPGPGVLSIDANGDVIYVPASNASLSSNNGIVINSGLVQLGSDCLLSNGALKSAQGLQSSRYLHLNGNNFIFGDGGRVGIGMPAAPFGVACNVGNKLEIDNGAANPNTSGVRLTRLTSNSPVSGLGGPNQITNQKILSVDVNGDIVLVAAPSGGTSLGNACGLTQNPLANPWEIPLVNNNFVFSRTNLQSGKVGIGDIAVNCVPGNVLEVSNNAATPNAVGQSGLRLTDLRFGAGLASSNGRVLSVDANGDVILVQDQTSVGGTGITQAQNGLSINTNNSNIVELGGPSGSATNAQFLGHREIPLNNFNLQFSGNQLNSKVHIGGTGGIGNYNAGAKLSVENHNETAGINYGYGIYSFSDYSSPYQNIAVAGEALDFNSTQFAANNIGVRAIAIGQGMQKGLDVRSGTSPGSTQNTHGVSIFAYSQSVNSPNTYGVFSDVNTIGQRGYGISGVCVNASIENYGGIFTAYQGGQVNYGIKASASGGSVDNWAGWFNGKVNVNGAYYLNGNSFTSDATFKTNIDTLNNITTIINQLKPRSFYFDTTNNVGMSFSSQKQYGFIAQDVENVLPELVSNFIKPAEYDSVGNVIYPSISYKSVNYNAFFAILTSAMQKQQSQLQKQDSLINVLTSQLQSLTQSVNACCSNSSVRTTGIKGNNVNNLDIELSDKDVIILNQNVPNPFAEHTTITYNVPEQYGFAQIIFKTLDGKIIKAVDINKKGKGQLNVFANDLSNGLYMYSLIVDGKVIDTKKMVKQ